MIAIMSESLIDAFSALEERKHELAAGSVLFRAGDAVLSLFLVVAGSMQLTRTSAHGVPLTLQRAGRGAILAEASLFRDRYHCEAIAAEPSVLCVLSRRRVVTALAADPALARMWMLHLAEEVQRARAHAETLSLKTTAARVDGWLASNEETLPPRGSWRQLAAEIAVTPEALYRELARRRR